VTERPILFSTLMVRAILAGTKTQTRRVVRGLATDATNVRMCSHYIKCDARPVSGRVSDRILCPYGTVGDRLWVRETFYCDHFRYPDAPIDEMSKLLEYRADHECRNWEAGCPCRDEYGRSSWRSSRFMPRWASRITLEVTGVRVERVQCISPEDAAAEGTPGVIGPLRVNSGPPAESFLSATYGFMQLWNAINGKRAGAAWADNPWVWVVSFRRVQP